MIIRGSVDVMTVQRYTGKKVTLSRHRNQLTYAAADISAALFAGLSEYIPRHIGIIYDHSDTAVALRNPSERDHTWATLATELGETGCNIFIIPVTQAALVKTTNTNNPYGYTPEVISKFKHNIVQFSGVLSPPAAAGFPLSAPYAASADLNGARLHQIVLLSSPKQYGSDKYIPVARTYTRNLVLGAPVLTDDIDFMIKWDIAFN